MVKNHARKNAARLRQQDAGGTYLANLHQHTTTGSITGSSGGSSSTIIDSDVLTVRAQGTILTVSWQPAPFTGRYDWKAAQFPQVMEIVRGMLDDPDGHRLASVNDLQRAWRDGVLGANEVAAAVVAHVAGSVDNMWPVIAKADRFVVGVPFPKRTPDTLEDAISMVRAHRGPALDRITDVLGFDTLAEAVHAAKMQHLKVLLDRSDMTSTLTALTEHGMVVYWPGSSQRTTLTVSPETQTALERVTADVDAGWRHTISVAKVTGGAWTTGNCVIYPARLSDGTQPARWDEVTPRSALLWFDADGTCLVHDRADAGDRIRGLEQSRARTLYGRWLNEQVEAGRVDVGVHVDHTGCPRWVRGQKFRTAYQKTPWTVRAVSASGRFVVATRGTGDRLRYMILDQHLGVFGVDNHHGLGYSTPERCQQVADALDGSTATGDGSGSWPVGDVMVSQVEVSARQWQWARFADDQPDEATAGMLPVLRAMLIAAPYRRYNDAVVGMRRPGEFVGEGMQGDPFETIQP